MHPAMEMLRWKAFFTPSAPVTCGIHDMSALRVPELLSTLAQRDDKPFT